MGIVGPSAGGKSTLARILAGHLALEVVLEGEAQPTSWRGADRLRRRRIQLVMQDPADALSPRLSVEELVREPLDVARVGDDAGRRNQIDAERKAAQRRRRIAKALAQVGFALPGSVSVRHYRCD